MIAYRTMVNRRLCHIDILIKEDFLALNVFIQNVRLSYLADIDSIFTDQVGLKRNVIVVT